MFDVKEINILIQALDDWEKACVRDVLSSSIIDACIMAGHEGADAHRAKVDTELARAELEQADRKEQAILLKAKLIQMRRELSAQSVDAFAQAINVAADNAMKEESQ